MNSALPRDERLVLLIQEASEVIQIATKILQHGWGDSRDPNTGVVYDNTELLTKELGDLDASRDLLLAADDVNAETVADYRRDKLAKLLKYLKTEENLALVQAIIEAEA